MWPSKDIKTRGNPGLESQKPRITGQIWHGVKRFQMVTFGGLPGEIGAKFVFDYILRDHDRAAMPA